MIKIRSLEILNDLIIKNDKQRKFYIKKNEEVYYSYEIPYVEAKNKASKYSYLWFLLLVAYLFVVLLLYKKMDISYIYISVIIVGIIIFSLLLYPLYLIKKRNNMKKKWIKAIEKNNPILESTIYINNEVAKTAVGIICLTENYYELQAIDDRKQLKQRWLILLSQYIDSINMLYDNKATSEDYYSYFKTWKEKVKKAM